MSNKKKAKVYLAEEGYDLYAGHYDRTLAHLDSFERYDLFEMLGDVKGKKVLDLGCGTGRMTMNLVKFGAAVTGVDVSEEMLNLARKKCRAAEFVLANSENLPFEEGSFDVVVASFLIVHLKGLEKTFDEVYRVLKPGGVFIVTNVNQRKAPKLSLDKGEIVIISFYHRPEDVLSAMEESFFEVTEERFVKEDGVWINQILKGKK